MIFLCLSIFLSAAFCAPVINEEDTIELTSTIPSITVTLNGDSEDWLELREKLDLIFADLEHDKAEKTKQVEDLLKEYEYPDKKKEYVLELAEKWFVLVDFFKDRIDGIEKSVSDAARRMFSIVNAPDFKKMPQKERTATLVLEMKDLKPEDVREIAEIGLEMQAQKAELGIEDDAE